MRVTANIREHSRAAGETDKADTPPPPPAHAQHARACAHVPLPTLATSTRGLQTEDNSYGAAGAVDPGASGAAAEVMPSAPRLHKKRARLMGHVAGDLVLDSEFLFLETMEKVFVGVRSMFLFVDQRVERLVLRLERLDHCLVHGCRSFRQADVTAP